MSDKQSKKIGLRSRFQAVVQAAKYRPVFTIGIIIASVFSVALEAVGLSFILPIIEIVQASGNPTANADGVLAVFVNVYEYLNIPLTLGSVIAGVSLVLTVRWTSTFVVRWLRGVLVTEYTREIQVQSFEKALEARIEYFDREGSDDILNAIVTQAEYAGRAITHVVDFVEQSLLSLMYLGIAMVLAPLLTLFTVALLGGFTVLFRFWLESGYDIGDRVAEANERVQQTAQAGTQGIRDTKLFGLENELMANFLNAVDQYASSSIKQTRNQQIIQNFYNLLTAVSIFVLIYLAIVFADLSLGSLSVFLFAMFRLGPKVSGLNSKLYQIENSLPHLVRTQNFIDELKENRKRSVETEPVPDEILRVEFDNLRFAYQGQDEEAIAGISFSFEKSDFIGFVGQSGAGKSTIVSLLARMYDPDSGEIRANNRSIHDMPVDVWREQIAVVQQDPFIFNDTLRYNLTIGNRDVSHTELERVAGIACVDEFLEDLPNGYETNLGDDGVRLSGGQRQRVALARALLKDAEILILDEATSDLDSNLEKKVQKSIENMEREYAIVGIAHRLSTIKNADIIYTIEDGKIIETGKHRELINSDGQYAKLYGIQSQEQ